MLKRKQLEEAAGMDLTLSRTSFQRQTRALQGEAEIASCNQSVWRDRNYDHSDHTTQPGVGLLALAAASSCPLSIDLVQLY